MKKTVFLFVPFFWDYSHVNKKLNRSNRYMFPICPDRTFANLPKMVPLAKE
jgi:hypothetical protein